MHQRLTEETATSMVHCRIEAGGLPKFLGLIDAFERAPHPGSLERGAWSKVGDPSAYCLIERWSDLASLQANRWTDAHRDLLVGIRSLGTLHPERLLVAPAPYVDDAPTLAELAAHDIRNSLAAVCALVVAVEERIAGAADLQTEVADLRVARAECRRMSRMVSDLVVRSRIERKRFHPEREATAVLSLLDDFARTIRSRAAASGVGVEVDADGTVAMLDRELVYRLLENLAENALRHVQGGGRIQLVARAEGDGLLRLAVRNTGPEVPARLHARLFRADASAGVGGARLGLYACRLIAEAHGGTISLVARAGWNVSFEAVLPIAAESRTR